MRYGRVEVRARFGVASGVWPAIWMLGSTQDIPKRLDDPETFWQTAASIPWPQCGEIDIMEYATRDADDAADAADARKNVHATFHWGDNWTGANYKYSGKVLAREDLDAADLSDPDSGWHTYGLAWTPDTLTITCDGEPVHAMESAAMANPVTGHLPFRENAFHLILNLALGSMANDPPANGEGYPATYAIDYVRIWQDPKTAGNQLLVGGKDRTFAGLTSNDANARALLPVSAAPQADGSVLLTDAPMVIGGFSPTKQVTLTLDVSIPEGAEGTIVGVKSGDTDHLRFVRQADGTATCRYNGDKQTVATACTLDPGRHTIRIAYDTNRPVRNGTALDSATSGTRVWVDDALVYVSPALVWAQKTVPYVTIGGDASDAWGTPMAGLRVHAATLTCGATPTRFTCSDPAGAFLLPTGVTRPEDGALLLASAPLEANGFADTAALSVTMDAEVPEGTTGALIGLRLFQASDDSTFTVSAECVGKTEHPLRHSGTKEHKDTEVYGRPSPGRHLYRLTHASASGTQLWEDDTLLASAPGIKFSNAKAIAVTFGGSAESESPAKRPLPGLKIHAANIDITSATPDTDALDALFTWPEGLDAAGFGVRRHLATVAANADGDVSVPTVSLNGKPLDTISAARALWFYDLSDAAELRLGVGALTRQDDGALTLTLDNGAPQTQGTLAPLFSFTCGGLSEDLSSAARDTLTLTLSGNGLSPGATYTLALGGTAHTATLQGNAQRATLTFTELPSLTDGDTLTLSGPTVPGDVALLASAWGGATGSTRLAAIVASDLIADGFVPANTTLSDHFYRIPAVATDGEGEVVALYDVRYGGGDLGDNKSSGIDLGETYGTDFGAQWNAPTLAVDVPNFRNPDGSLNTPITKEKDIGDAAILYDPNANRYWLMAHCKTTACSTPGRRAQRPSGRYGPAARRAPAPSKPPCSKASERAEPPGAASSKAPATASSPPSGAATCPPAPSSSLCKPSSTQTWSMPNASPPTPPTTVPLGRPPASPQKPCAKLRTTRRKTVSWSWTMARG